MICVQGQGRWSAFETRRRIYYLCKQGSEFIVVGSLSQQSQELILCGLLSSFRKRELRPGLALRVGVSGIGEVTGRACCRLVS